MGSRAMPEPYPFGFAAAGGSFGPSYGGQGAHGTPYGYPRYGYGAPPGAGGYGNYGYLGYPGRVALPSYPYTGYPGPYTIKDSGSYSEQTRDDIASAWQSLHTPTP